MSRGKKGKVLLKPPRRVLEKRTHPDQWGNDQYKERERINTVVELMQQGFNSVYIKKFLKDSAAPGEKISAKYCGDIITQANSFISQQYASKVKSVQAIHVQRYNDMINTCLETEELSNEPGELDDFDEMDPNGEFDDENDTGGYSPKDIWLSRQRKIKAYFDAINTMYQKEKVLQMHSKSFTYVINEEVDVTINNNEKKPEFDASKLSTEELIELLEYIRICRVSENSEVLGVTEFVRPEEVTVDVEAEIIQPANVDSIKHEVKDVKVKIEPVYDVTSKLKAAMMKLVEKKLTEDNPGEGIKVITQEILKQ